MNVKSKWPMPPALLGVSIVVMVALHYLLPVVRVIPWPWNLTGIAPILLGVVWNIWADQLFKKHETTVKPHQEPMTFVEAGPFRFSRNPIYVGMIAIIVGVAVVLGSLIPMFVSFLFTVILRLVFIPMEENSMEAAFGDNWLDYKNAYAAGCEFTQNVPSKVIGFGIVFILFIVFAVRIWYYTILI